MSNYRHMTAPHGRSQGAPSSPPPPAPDPRERIARFKTLSRRAVGYWLTAAILFLLGSGIGLAIAVRVQRIYRSECVVLVKPGKDDREGSPAERALKMAPRLQAKLITRERLTRIINEFKLYPKTVDSRGMLEAIEEMRTHIGFRGRESQTFIISFEAEKPELVRDVTQRLADTMIEDFKAAATEETTGAAASIKGQLHIAEAAKDQATLSLATFGQVNADYKGQVDQVLHGQAVAPAPTTPATNPAYPSAPMSSDPLLSTLFQKKAALEAEARGGQAAPPVSPALQAKVDEATSARDAAKTAFDAANADLSSKSGLTDEHPDKKDARARVASARATLAAAEARLAEAKAAAIPPPPTSNLTPELKERIDQVNAQIAARQAEIKRHAPTAAIRTADAAAPPAPLDNIAKEREFQRLSDAYRAAQTQVTALRDQLQKAGSVEGDKDRMDIIDAAYLPSTPSKGGRGKVAMMGMIVALLAAIAYAYARVIFSDVIIDAGDIEALHVVPVLGVMPRISAAKPAPTPKEGAPGGV